MSLAGGAPQKSPLGAFIKSALGVRGFAGGGDIFVVGSWTGTWNGENWDRAVRYGRQAGTWGPVTVGTTIYSVLHSHAGLVYAGRASPRVSVGQSPIANCIAVYDPDLNQFVPASSGDDALTGHVAQLFTFGGKLCAAGEQFSTPNTGALNKVIQFDGPGWSSLGSPDISGTYRINDVVEIPGGKLYAIGYAGTGGTFCELSSGAWLQSNAWLHTVRHYAIEYLDGYVYIGGDDVSSQRNLYRWPTAATFLSLSDLELVGDGSKAVETTNGPIFALKVFEDAIHCAGSFTYATADSDPGADDHLGSIARIVGNAFESLNGGLRLASSPSSPITVHRLAVIGGALAACADNADQAGYPSADLTDCKNFMAWNGSAWTKVNEAVGVDIADDDVFAALEAA